MSPSTPESLPFFSELLSNQPPEDETLERRKTLIKQTWRSIEFGLGEGATKAFYNRLFTKFPSVEPLFANTSLEVQSLKLYQTLRLAVRSLDDLDSILPTVQELGRRHAQSYGVVPEYYAAVTQVFIEILHEYICSHFTNMACSRYIVDVADAWAWCLNLIGSVMIDAAPAAAAAADDDDDDNAGDEKRNVVDQ